MLNNLCEVLDNRKIAQDMYKLVLKNNYIATNAMPGQFVHIKIPCDNSIILRRPISIYNADKHNEIFELVYQVTGKGTQALSKVSTGVELDILGPLGNGFDPGHAKKIYLVGGGCGTAPLRFIPGMWPNKEYHTFLGYGSVYQAYDLHMYDDASQKFYLTSVDGSLGVKGVITDLLSQALSNDKPDLLMACGPAGMLKQVKKLCEKHSVPCQVSLEERMGCGVGGCLVCSCKVKTSENEWDYKRVCKDGPVFWSQEVLFDE